ncbi:albumin-1-like [Vicia villosa]|uniref:albumin-1-like n=1 Tax=Vicia villosa TaxID=3911 RepID=UPI00273CE10D|nr:albumin-1-like [Vicia villosa]
MAYAKLSLLPLFLLATFLLMFPMKEVEAVCPIACFLYKPKGCGDGCKCVPASLTSGVCVKASFQHVTMMVEKHPNLCGSHADCTKKESGSFCARFPNSEIEYGWCFDSNSHAEASFKNALNSEFSNLLKMPSEVST